MKLRPLHDRVIVKRLENETKTASGIFIPDNAAEKPDQGEVLAVGPGKRNEKGDFVALNVKVGDRVLFGKYSGQTVKVDGDELLVMKEDDLFAVVVLGLGPRLLAPLGRRAERRGGIAQGEEDLAVEGGGRALADLVGQGEESVAEETHRQQRQDRADLVQAQGQAQGVRPGDERIVAVAGGQGFHAGVFANWSMGGWGLPA